jgi:hypothetical protein
MANENMTAEEQAAADAANAAAAEQAAADARAREAERIVAEEAEAARLARMTQEERDRDMVNKLVQDRVETELSPIKGKLDAAFKQRDEALQLVKELERKEREARLKLMEDEGKHQEVANLRLAEAQAEIAALKKHNTELSRDVAVREALKSYVFRNDKASDMAFKEIITNLTQNEQGVWVHRSGISVRDYCEAFSKNEEQSFLFKPKSNSGGGSTTTTTTPVTTTKPKSLFDMPQAEVLALAAAGKLGGQPQ